MVQLCRHIHPNGRTCSSPALRGQRRCYFHAKGRRPAGQRLPSARPGYRWYGLQRQIPLLQLSDFPHVLSEISAAILNHEISPARTGKLLHALEAHQIALRRTMMNEPPKCNDSSTKLANSLR